MERSSPWSLLLTAPNVEKRVSTRLSDASFNHLLLRQYDYKIRHGRKIETLTVAFPRYIFVVAQDAWERIRQIAGVIDFVRAGNAPARISDQVINNLRARLDRDGILPAQTLSKFSFGQKVIIKSATGEREAIFQFALPRDRACVMQEWFGTYRNVEVDESDLISAADYASVRRSRRLRKREQRQRRYRSTLRTAESSATI